jgi:uncharacterized membrane protein YeiH
VAPGGNSWTSLESRAKDLGLQLSRGEVASATAAMDSNADGKIDVTEYTAWLARQAEREARKAEAVALRQFVENTSGKRAMQILTGVDYFGTGLFAMAGTVVAAQAGMNVLGCGLVACITAMGGGTVSNLLCGQVPVFWMREPGYLYVCAAVSALTFACYPALCESTALEHSHAVFVGDTLGLAAFSIIGAQHGIRLGLPPFVCCCGGVVIVFGGLIRDVLCHRDIALGGSDPYASATLAGATVYVGLRQLAFKLRRRIPLSVRIALAATTVISLRCGSSYYGWSLPTWRHKDHLIPPEC